MTSKKQLHANKDNAQLSTGAKTSSGKSIVSKNAIKHGIFNRGLCLEKNECPNEYRQFHQQIINSFNPEDQFQHNLAEKIAIDQWRLRRTLLFELSSTIRNEHGEMQRHYNPDDILLLSQPTDESLNKKNGELSFEYKWTEAYIKLLKTKKNIFNKPVLDNEEFEFDIYDDLILALSYVEEGIISKDEFNEVGEGQLSFNDLRKFIKNWGVSDRQIAQYLLDHYENSLDKIREQINELERKLQINNVVRSTCIIPSSEDIDKVLRYEKHLQKSIVQNTLLLKRLQEEG